MWYETNWFVIVMIMMSVLMFVANFKRAGMTFDKAADDLEQAKKEAGTFGKHAVLIFTIITTGIMVAYIWMAGMSGLFPVSIAYALVLMKLIGLMVEYGSLQNTWGYGKKSFAFDKIQCWIHLATAIGVVSRLFMTGIVRF